MKILIIGSKGFIGSHLVTYFQSKDYDVWQCDVVVDYVERKYFQVDVSNSDFLQLFEEQQFEMCINCSGAASVPDSLVHPMRDFNLNTLLVFNVLNAIYKHNRTCKFMNLSSAAVYGNPQQLPIKESFNLNPISPYGKHKLMAEMLCSEFYTNFGLQTCSLRIFSAFGEGLKKQLFWDIFQKMKKSNTLELYGTGKETRDFIHVEDIAQSVELAIHKARFEADFINVANGMEISISEAVLLFIKGVGWHGEIKFLGTERLGDPLYWCADIDVIKSFGYKQQITLENGLNQYIKWVKENS